MGNVVHQAQKEVAQVIEQLKPTIDIQSLVIGQNEIDFEKDLGMN